MPLLGKFDPQQVREYLGLSGIDKSRAGEDTMIYQAGVALDQEPKKLPDGLHHRAIKSGKYARFLLTGPYSHIWNGIQLHLQNFVREACGRTSRVLH